MRGAAACSSVLVALLEELYCDDVMLMTMCVILLEQNPDPPLEQQLLGDLLLGCNCPF